MEIGKINEQQKEIWKKKQKNDYTMMSNKLSEQK